MPSKQKSLYVNAFCYTSLSNANEKRNNDMPTKRFDKKHWKMVVVLLVICGAMLLLRWAAMIWG
ncbi:transmembrane anchor protein [Escherichia albertii KF1]|nr:transmembrane anchor protein [Escherichia albertii KF1]